MSNEIHKIQYTEWNGAFRPLLEVMLFSQDLLKNTTKTLALLDSGADMTLIPFSLGRVIGLESPSEGEFQEVSGVGGTVSYIKRRARIYIYGKNRKRAYGFDEDVHWAYPNQVVQDKVKELLGEMELFETFSGQALDGTDLQRYLKDQKENKFQEAKSLMDNYEVNFLLGRPFFQNFDYVQFLQRDRTDESKNAIHFSIRTPMLIEEISLEIVTPEK